VRRPALTAAIVVGSILTSCASPGVPPGGPEDRSPPRLVRISPETNSVNVRPREVVFSFDEVVSESPRGGGLGSTGGAGTAGAGNPLEPLVVVSPRAGSVEVDWRRDRIAVRPRRGFQPNTTYRVTLLAGLADLRNNVRDSAAVLVFSTGGSLATQRLSGVIFDWVNGKPAPKAVAEAIAEDSTVFYTIADSVGRFTIENLPPGAYLVKGTVDVNTNRAPDPREPFDTVRVDQTAVARGDTAAAELYAFVRDTIGPRIQTVVPQDSLRLRVTFDRPLAPGQAFTAANFSVVAADSAPVTLAQLLSAAELDSLNARQARASADSAARADTTARGRAARAARDSAARGDSLARAARDTAGGRRRSIAAPVPRRPTPPTEIILVLAAPLRPQTAYRVTAQDVRGLAGRTRTSDRVITTPRAQPASPTAPPAGTAPTGAPPTTPLTTPPGTPPPAPTRPPTAPPAGATRPPR
jgi:hypothetical protein